MPSVGKEHSTCTGDNSLECRCLRATGQRDPKGLRRPAHGFPVLNAFSGIAGSPSHLSDQTHRTSSTSGF